MRRYLWNHRAHEVWGESRLCFWRFRFSPTYQQRKIRHALMQSFNQAGVTSFALYEILGYWDIVARLWLPRAMPLARMEAIFFEHLETFDYEDSEFFEVGEIVRHWVWETSNHSVRAPHESFLNRRPNDSLIAAANRVTSGDVSLEVLSTSERQFVDELIASGTIAPLNPGNGLKVFVSIRRSTGVLAKRARDSFIHRIADSCDRLASVGISELSLYGGVTESLILARLPISPSLHEALRSVIEDFNKIGLDDLFRTRTTTAIAVHREFFEFQDHLPTRIEEEVVFDLEQLLVEEETDTIEFKSSAYADVNHYLHRDVPVPPASDAVALQGLVKTICGMLNSRLGGTLILGVGEPDKLLKGLKGDLATRAAEIIGGYPTFGRLSIFGIDLDVQALGLHDPDAWDIYVRRLQSFISAHILPNPSALLRFRGVYFEGKQLAIVQVSASSDEWFYLVDKGDYHFYVRRNAMTEELKAVDQDRYKGQ